MAGRIRSIKPELLKDDKTAALSHEGWRFFVSLLLLADDYGNFRAHPALLDGAIFWGCPSGQGVARLLREVGEAGLVTIYSVREQSYGHINGWARHQRVDKPGKPRCPGPKEAENVLQFEDSRIVPEPFRTDLRSPITDHRPGPPRGEGEGAGVARRLPPAPVEIPKKHRAHRLPPDWKPSTELVAKLREAFEVDPLQCLEAFTDWAASSPKAVKLDWDATFRSWVRREAKDGKLEPLPDPPKQRDLGYDPNDKSGVASEESKKILRDAMARLTQRIDDDNARVAEMISQTQTKKH